MPLQVLGARRRRGDDVDVGRVRGEDEGRRRAAAARPSGVRASVSANSVCVTLSMIVRRILPGCCERRLRSTLA